MKTFIVLPVSIVLASILFCPMAMAAPPFYAERCPDGTARSFAAKGISGFLG